MRSAMLITVSPPSVMNGFWRKYRLGRILFLKNLILKRVLAGFGLFYFEIAVRLVETIAWIDG